MGVTGTYSQSRTAASQIRRAWIIITTCTFLFGVIIVLIVAGALYVYTHASVAQSANLEIVHGSGVLWKSESESEWRLVSGEIELDEGDQVSTRLGSFAIVKMFDGTVVEVAEDSVIELEKMRASRFVDRTKLIKIRLISGASYLEMAPRGDYQYSELVVDTEATTSTMANGDNGQGSGKFLVELVPAGAPDTDQLDQHNVRIAVEAGALQVVTPVEDLQLASNQQITVFPNGSTSELTTPLREFIVNGTFKNVLAGWLEFQEPAAEDSATPGRIEVVPYSEVNTVDNAVQLSYSSENERSIELGVEQRIGQTIREFSDLIFSFEVKLVFDRFTLTNAENNEFPLTVELNYIDKNANIKTMRRSYYPEQDDVTGIRHAVASPLTSNVWELVVLDLSHLRPRPAQITSVVLYASGGNFQTQVANVSLTSSELISDGE